jgi:hypothetical protein
MDLGRDDAPIIKTSQEINYNLAAGMQMQNEPLDSYPNVVIDNDDCSNPYDTGCVQKQVRRVDNCNTSCCTNRCVQKQVRRVDNCNTSCCTNRCVQKQVRRVDNCNTSCCSTGCERQVRTPRCVDNSCGYSTYNLRSYY